MAKATSEPLFYYDPTGKLPFNEFVETFLKTLAKQKDLKRLERWINRLFGRVAKLEAKCGKNI
jgi:hypothetical protein